MYVKRLEIKNLRSFEETVIELNAPGSSGLQYPNVNVFLGDNGMGKTTVLRAIALAVLGSLMSGASGFVSRGLVRLRPGDLNAQRRRSRLKPARVSADVVLSAEETSPKHKLPSNLTLMAEVELFGDAERIGWAVNPPEPHIAKLIEELQFDSEWPGLFLVGYGAGRRVEASSRVDESARVKARVRRYERVAGLFEDNITLMPLSFWLPRFEAANKGRYTQVISLINDLLPPNCRIQSTATETEQGNEHLFEMNGIVLPFSRLSDGYRAYIGWIGDMLFHVCAGVGRGQKLRELRGVVLIDEVDLHLHPEWQRVVVPTLAKALPNVQFVITTHSPLVVGSLESGNLFVLEELDGASNVTRLAESVRGKSADQILLSPYFGLESSRADDAAAELAQLARDAVAGDKDASLRYLSILAKGTASKSADKPVEVERARKPSSRSAAVRQSSSQPKSGTKRTTTSSKK